MKTVPFSEVPEGEVFHSVNGLPYPRMMAGVRWFRKLTSRYVNGPNAGFARDEYPWITFEPSHLVQIVPVDPNSKTK